MKRVVNCFECAGITAMCIACALVASCATVPAECKAPEVQKIYVPIAQEATRELPAVPIWDVDSLPIGASIDEQVKALLAERKKRKGYEIELLGSCK